MTPAARAIQPLGEQIIIRTIPVNEVGSIIIPDSAKSITMLDPDKPMDSVHFVEAEVIAVGPGKRLKGDLKLLGEFVAALRSEESFDFGPLFERYDNPQTRIAPLVKPGDRILYHPAVQRFDRKVEGLGEGEYFIIREESVLAVIERDGAE